MKTTLMVLALLAMSTVAFAAAKTPAELQALEDSVPSSVKAVISGKVDVTQPVITSTAIPKSISETILNSKCFDKETATVKCTIEITP